MADTQGNDSRHERWDPRDPGFADLLADALSRQQGAAGPDLRDEGTNGDPSGSADRELDEALEALGEPRLEGENAEAWITRLLADEDLRAHVADLGAARLAADETTLNPRVRAAALEAAEHGAEPLAAPASPSIDAARRVRARAGARGVRTEPLRATGWRPATRTRTWVAAAAVLCVAVGAGLYFAAQGRTAEAGLQLTSLARIDLAGSVRMSSVEPRYFAALGRVYTPAADELLSFGFGRDALLVVGAGDAVRVTRSPLLERIADDLDEIDQVDSVLRLEAGEARLATMEGPLLLEVDAAGVLVLAEGAAHVAFDAGDGSGVPAVALAEGSVAYFYGRDGSHVPLAGPSRVRLTADGPQDFGEPAHSLFRDLEFFGGPLPQARLVRHVSPRLWRVEAGAVRRGPSDVRILADADDTAAAVRLAWHPPFVLAGAETLQVALRAPAGTRVSLPGLGADTVATLGAVAAAPGGEPGTARVELPLPPGWFGRLQDGALHVRVTVPGNEPEAEAASGRRGRPSKTRAWFDGVAFVVPGSIQQALRRAKELGGE